MEYRYSRELKHNYLIVKREALEDDENREKTENYQVKMIESGKVGGFIPCDRRVINNEQFLYYEINSMQSIKDRFAVKGMDYRQIISFFDSLRKALEGLSEYLLGIENVVFDAKSVFYDLNAEKFMFMYCPFYRSETDFAGFTDALFDLVDHDDERAVELVYNLSERAQEDGCLVLECVEEVLKAGKEHEDSQVSAISQDDSADEVFIKEELGIVENQQDKKEAGSFIKFKGLAGKAQIIFGVLFILVVAAMMFIRMNYILSDQENVLSIIVMIVSVVSSLAAFLSGIKDIVRKEKPVQIECVNKKEEDVADRFFAEESNPAKLAVQVNPQPRHHIAECGETVVLGTDDDGDKNLTLYSCNMDKTIRISLDKLPITIGKLEGCVDKVVNDKSISRIHCKIMNGIDGSVKLVDLNSTNGTFRNGVKLEPQEEICLEEGDEVRIGRICFDCR